MITVCDISALARWGEVGLAERLGDPVASPAGLDWTLGSARELAGLDLGAARLEATPERPLHVLVGSEERRVRSRRVRCHIWSTPLPEGALYRLGPEVLLASPGFCLQQMAAGSSLARAASVGTEICGCYARSPRAPRGFHVRPPLEAPDALLDRFLHSHGYGARRAREALEYVVPGSRSPMETVVVLLFTLPPEVGGCGLPRPLLNARVGIPPALQRALGKPYLVVDLVWTEWGVILEYDSYEYHGLPAQVDSDNVRSEGLRDLGWMVRSVTSGMLLRDAFRRDLAEKVMRRAGRPVPQEARYDALQRSLVRELVFLEGFRSAR